jgi:ribosomal protein S18
MARSWPALTDGLLDAAGSKLRFAAHIDVTQSAARVALRRGLPVSISRSGFSPAVAEMALTLILTTLRKTSDFHAQMGKGAEPWVKSFPDDIDMLLVGPNGVGVMIFSDVGGGNAINNVTVTLSDSASASLSVSRPIVAGTYKPTDAEPGDVMPTPAPAGPYGASLSAFNGISANGIWSLYVVDDGSGDSGMVNGGWSLMITTAAADVAPTISGIAAPDFASFTGGFDCPSRGVSGGFNASHCGNGQIDEGESCDDGNRSNGDCCSASCGLYAQGAACSDDGSPCTSDTCNATGQCEHVNRTGTCDDGNGCTAGDTCVNGQCVGAVQPDDAACDDGNRCTTGDRCQHGTCTSEPVVCPSCLECNVDHGCVPAIANGCKQASATSLVLRHSSHDAVIWHWNKGDSTSSQDLGDPSATTDYDFCIYNGRADSEGAPELVVGARAPAGPDWTQKRHGFAYARPDLAPDGVRRALVIAGTVGKSRVWLRAAGDALQLPELASIPLPITVQLKSTSAASPHCWTAEFGHAETQNAHVVRAERETRLPDARPNILVVNLDDTRADGIDRMPNLAQLASESVSFSNSFVVNPLCAPSRASLFTGLYARHHGVHTLSGARRFRELGSDRQTIAVWMHEAGYRTGLFGKYVNGYGYGGTEQVIGPGGTYYVPPGWTRWRVMPSPEHYGGEHGETYSLIDEYGHPTVYGDHATDRQYSTDVTAAEVRAFIAESVGQRRPFFRRKKTCPFSGDKAPKIDYKDGRLLGRYVSERGKIVPSRITAVSAKKQRELAKAIKRSRFIGLLPYVIK